MICPNCQKEIPAGMAFCPHCGTYLQSYAQQTPNNNKNTNNVLIGICAVLVVLLLGAIGFGAWYYISTKEKEKEAIAQQLRDKERALQEAEERTPDTIVVEKTKTVTVPPPAPAYTEPINPSTVLILGNVVNVRSDTSLGASVIGVVYKGQSVEYAADYGEWYGVYVNGYYGYIRKHHTNGKRIAIAQ